MAKHSRDNRPYMRPVTRLVLSESNVKLRWISIALLLAIAVVSIGYGAFQALSTDPGWQVVQSNSNTVNCGDDFVLMYEFDGTVNPTAQLKKLEAFYTRLTERGYQLFSPDAEGTDNLYWVNANVNKIVTVAPDLYKALEQISISDSRHPYMGPAVAMYDGLFLSATDEEAARFDPMKTPELSAVAAQITSWCADSSAVFVEVFGDQRVRLTVSEDYLTFAREYGIDNFLDLTWMTNAFVIDYLADALEAEGFVNGYLTSYDGFTRNLDDRGNEYSVNFFDRQGTSALIPASLNYREPVSVVFLRDYPLSEEDRWHYHAYADGSITHVFLDPADGRCKAATDSLMAYSGSRSCAEILLEVAPVFTADQLDREVLQKLSSKGTESLWYEGTTLCHTQQNPNVTILPESGGAGYTLE